MAYIGNRWGAPATKYQKVEYVSEDEYKDFADKVRKDFCKIIDYINNEQNEEIRKINDRLTKLEVTQHYVKNIEEDVAHLQCVMQQLIDRQYRGSGTKRRLRVTVRAGKDKVQIIRND